MKKYEHGYVAFSVKDLKNAFISIHSNVHTSTKPLIN